MHRRSILFCLFVTALLVVSPTAASDRIEKSFEVSSGGLLTISTERGSIEVYSGEGSGMNIEIIPKGWSIEDLEADFDIRFSQNGNDVELEMKAKKKLGSWFSWGRKSFVVRAEVPLVYNVDLKTSGGSISVDDLNGEVKSATSGGSLSMGSIDGPVFGRTSGGSITLEEASGDVDVKTSGGSITIGDVDGAVNASTSGGSVSVARTNGPVVVSTSGGGIEIEDVSGSLEARTSGGPIRATISRQPEGDCRLTTSGGGITVHLAPGLSFDLDAKTSGGSVRTDMEVSVRGEMKKNRIEGKLNGGGPELYLRTSGGGIQIKPLS